MMGQMKVIEMSDWLIIFFVFFTMIFIFLVGSLLIHLNKYKKANIELHKKVEILSHKAESYNYEQDTQFLMYIIGYKCKVYTNMVIKPLNNIDAKLLSGNELDKAVSEITVNIEKLLSEDYRTLLSKYFYISNDQKNDELTKFIAETVLDTMTTTINTYNSKKIKAMNKPTKSDQTLFQNKKDID
jgi:hypothetical protein